MVYGLCRGSEFQVRTLWFCCLVVLLSCCLVDRHYHKRTLQTTKQLNNQTTKQQIRLEACTEQSESNPGRSLGITDKKKAAVWKTVPSHPIKHQWIKIKLKMDKDIYISLLRNTFLQFLIRKCCIQIKKNVTLHQNLNILSMEEPKYNNIKVVLTEKD